MFLLILKTITAKVNRVPQLLCDRLLWESLHLLRQIVLLSQHRKRMVAAARLDSDRRDRLKQVLQLGVAKLSHIHMEGELLVQPQRQLGQRNAALVLPDKVDDRPLD